MPSGVRAFSPHLALRAHLLTLSLPQGKLRSPESQQRVPEGRCLEAMDWVGIKDGESPSCPLWLYYAIPGALVRTGAMPPGLRGGSCHLVRWFVLSTT